MARTERESAILMAGRIARLTGENAHVLLRPLGDGLEYRAFSNNDAWRTLETSEEWDLATTVASMADARRTLNRSRHRAPVARDVVIGHGTLGIMGMLGAIMRKGQ